MNIDWSKIDRTKLKTRVGYIVSDVGINPEDTQPVKGIVHWPTHPPSMEESMEEWSLDGTYYVEGDPCEMDLDFSAAIIAEPQRGVAL